MNQPDRGDSGTPGSIAGSTEVANSGRMIRVRRHPQTMRARPGDGHAERRDRMHSPTSAGSIRPFGCPVRSPLGHVDGSPRRSDRGGSSSSPRHRSPLHPTTGVSPIETPTRRHGDAGSRGRGRPALDQVDRAGGDRSRGCPTCEPESTCRLAATLRHRPTLAHAPAGSTPIMTRVTRA
jgi:hypothetical protein